MEGQKDENGKTKVVRKIYVAYDDNKGPKNLISKLQRGTQAESRIEEEEHFLTIFDDSKLTKKQTMTAKASHGV